MTSLYLLVHPPWDASAAADVHLEHVPNGHQLWHWWREGTLDARYLEVIRAAGAGRDHAVVLVDDLSWAGRNGELGLVPGWSCRELPVTFTSEEVRAALCDVRDVDEVVVAGFSRHDCIPRALAALLGDGWDDPWVAGDVVCDDAVVLPWTKEAADAFARRTELEAARRPRDLAGDRDADDGLKRPTTGHC